MTTLPALHSALDRTTEDLARVLSEGSGSLSIAAIAQERARIREAMNKTKGER